MFDVAGEPLPQRKFDRNPGLVSVTVANLVIGALITKCLTALSKSPFPMPQPPIDSHRFSYIFLNRSTI
jgi:hypothetical protein